MKRFDALDITEQTQAYEKLAFELLDSYLQNSDEDIAEERLMGLVGQK